MDGATQSQRTLMAHDGVSITRTNGSASNIDGATGLIRTMAAGHTGPMTVPTMQASPNNAQGSRPRVIWFAVVAACSRAAPPAPNAKVEHSPQTKVEAVVPPEPLPRSCPATFAAAAGRCESRDICRYVDGTCFCGHPQHCGGDADQPELREPRTWQCTPQIRADGCPGGAPPPDSLCEIAGKMCSYSCSCELIATCTDGRWVLQHGECMP